jgi:hypothetical protein
MGFLLALLFWVLIGRRFAIRTIEYTAAGSAVVLQLDGKAPAFAATILLISLSSVNAQQVPPVTNTCYTGVA